MSTQPFRFGEIIDVTITGLRVLAQDEYGLLLERRDGSTEALPLDDQTVATRVTPADGEPQPGDLWRDVNGTMWFAFADLDEDTGDYPTLMCSQDTYSLGSAVEPRRVNHLYGPLELVYRPEPVKSASAPCLDTECGPDFIAAPDAGAMLDQPAVAYADDDVNAPGGTR